MAIDAVAELIGEVLDGLADVAFRRAKGWDLFWRIVVVFVVIPAIIIGLYCWLGG